METIDRDTPGRKSPSTEPTDSLFIVGIGISAGGLEAIEEFFSHMPADTGMAFVVIQHLSPTHKSYMVELLGRKTDMTVQVAKQDITLAPDQIYLIPVSKNISIEDGKLKLVAQDRSTRTTQYPIDIFLQSLALYGGDRSIGIVLSGTGSDGSRGLRSIKESGGLTLVQTPDSAQFDGMPRSAIASTLIDQVLPPHEMPQVLINYTNHLNTILGRYRQDETLIAEAYSTILNAVQKRTDVDFHLYKPPTIKRRIEHRMGMVQTVDLQAYADLVKHSEEESYALYQELLIGVTRFFRNREAWTYLEKEIIPSVFERAMLKAHPVIRCWIAACSTGEEAYSLAILLHEYRNEFDGAVDIKIFATDIDTESMEKASRGIYTSSIVADITQTHLHRYFIRQGENFQVARELRQMILFTPHNLTQDVSFSNIDILCCRNVLIYLKPHTQTHILNSFAHALNHEGVLFLGKSEHISGFERYFTPLPKKHNLFIKEGSPPRTRTLNTVSNYAKPTNALASFTSRHLALAPALNEEDYLKETLAKYMPPSLVVDKDNNVLYLLGNVNQFLDISPGIPSMIAPRILHKDIRILVGTALHNVFREKTPSLYVDVTISSENTTLVFDLNVAPIIHRGEINKAIILFDIKQEEKDIQDIEPKSFNIDQLAQQRIEDLERQVMYTKESLHAAIEELETSNEELSATNEELMASNEELQSTNEELQSTNEELSTVNVEIRQKMKELTELSRDMNNLLESTDICTLFLDKQLHIRKFTQPVAEHIFLKTSDLGRPIHHFAHSFVQVDFGSLCKEVLKTGTAVEREIENQSSEWFLLHITPYRTENGTILGVVITFVDITEIRNSRRIIELNNVLQREIAERTYSQKTLEDLVYLTSHELKSPVRAFHFLVETLQEDIGTSTSALHAPKFNELYKRIKRLEGVVDDLLLYSRLDRMDETLETCHLPSLTAAILEKSHPPEGFTVHEQYGLVDEFNTSAENLRRVLAILIDNAVKHHHHAEDGTLWIEADTQEHSTRFTLRDDGPGISEKKRSMLFQPFHPERPRAEDGSLGISLFLARRLVELRGGAFLLSPDHPGVTLSFTWPHARIKPSSIPGN